MRKNSVIFGLLIGLFQSNLFPIVTQVGAVTIQGTSCLSATDESLCVTCDTTGVCDSSLLGEATIVEKCGGSLPFCDSATGTCVAEASADCAYATICPNGAASGCVADPRSIMAYVNCDKSDYVLCEDSAGANGISWVSPQCGCTSDCSTNIYDAACLPIYLPPGSPGDCAERYFLCQAATGDLQGVSCSFGECYDAATCACIETPPTTLGTTEATTVDTSTQECLCGGILLDPDTQEYCTCFIGTDGCYGTTPILESCLPGTYNKDTCECECPAGDCPLLPDVDATTCWEYLACQEVEGGNAKYGKMSCPNNETQCFDKATCGCKVMSAITTLGPGETTPNNCAEYSELYGCQNMRPDETNKTVYYTCLAGFDDQVAHCEVGSLFVIESCNCLPCNQTTPQYIAVPPYTGECDTTEYYFCDYSEQEIYHRECKDEGYCFSAFKQDCVKDPQYTTSTTTGSTSGGGGGCDPAIECTEHPIPGNSSCYTSCLGEQESGCCKISGTFFNDTFPVCACVEDPNATTPGEDDTTTTPSGTTKDPSGTTQDPSGTTQDPSGTTLDPSGTTLDPSGTTPDSSGTTSAYTTSCGANPSCSYGAITSTTNGTDYIDCNITNPKPLYCVPSTTSFVDTCCCCEIIVV